MDVSGAATTSRRPWHVEVAAHFAEAWPAVEEAVRRSMDPAAPVHLLVQYGDAVTDYGIDFAARQPEPSAGHRLLPPATAAGAQLVILTNQLDRRLAALESGGLIRLVCQAERGAIVCDSVARGRHLVGTSLVDSASARPGEYPEGQPSVTAADEALARLASDLRRQLALWSQDPGGFEAPDPGAGAVPADSYHLAGELDDHRAAICREALATNGLHYVAYRRVSGAGSALFTADILEHQLVAAASGRLEAKARRERYQDLVDDLEPRIAGLAVEAAPILPPPVTRVVLDVEHGAVHYYRIRRGEYLVGVTLLQAQVSIADLAAYRAADALRRLNAAATDPD